MKPSGAWEGEDSETLKCHNVHYTLITLPGICYKILNLMKP